MPQPGARVLWYDDLTPFHIVVSKESGITDVQGLDGQKFSSGGTGMTIATVTEAILAYLDIQPDYVQSNKADSADAVGNRQIVGISATGSEPDSFVMQIGASIGIDLLSWDEALADEIVAQFPYLTKHVTPAGTYDGVDHDTLCLALMQGCQTNSSLPQEVGYKMIKAFNESGRALWEETNASAARQDTIELILNSAIPLHAGTVQYLVELGYEVPAQLIPAEYVPVA